MEATVSQGEQLQNAENMAEETEYKLDRATRLLRGMTWAGWLANKVTRDVEPPEYNRQKQENNDISPAASSPSRMKSSGTGPPAVYDQAPGSCQAAAQSVQNYSCNLLVLETCETEEQKETCIMICNNMYNMATKEIALLQQQLQKSNGGVKDDDNVINFVDRLVADMKTLRVRQLKSQHLKRGITKQGDSSESPTKSANQSNNRNQVASLTENSPSLSKSTAASPPKVGDLTQTQQEEHLDTMAYHLGELNQLASNLSHSLLGQTETIDSLEDKTESMLFKSRMNTRRADRLIQKKVRPKIASLFYLQISFVCLSVFFKLLSRFGCKWTSLGHILPRENLPSLFQFDTSLAVNIWRYHMIMDCYCQQSIMKHVFLAYGSDKVRFLGFKASIPNDGLGRVY